MKKWMICLLLFVGILFTGTGLGVIIRLIREKPAAVEIIGGADGPTSIFLAGKIGRWPEN